MIQIDWQSRVPVYEQIVRGILRLKTLGVLAPDEQLPSVRALAAETGVNPNTVQKAYQLLEAKGIIYSVTGKGSFLSGDDDANDAILRDAELRITKALQEAAQMGLDKEKAQEILRRVYEERGMTHD